VNDIGLHTLLDAVREQALNVKQKFPVTENGSKTNQLINDYMGDAIDLINICEEFPGVREPAGRSAQMYLDAILRMIDGLTEAAMLILESVQNAQKAGELEAEATSWTAISSQFATYSGLEASKATSFSAEGKALSAAGAQMKAAAGVSTDTPAKSNFAANGAFSATAGVISTTTSGFFKSGVAPLTAMSTQAATQAGIAAAKAATHTEWMSMDMAQAAIKIAQIVIETVSWAMSVIGVPVVPELPLPIVGWDIVDPYDWVAGSETIEIMEEPIIKVENEAGPAMVIQGTNKTKTINDYVIDEKIEYPTIGYDGGGTVFD